MLLFNFALVHSEPGINTLTIDLIILLSFSIVIALPMSLLRPQLKEELVKGNVFRSRQ